MRLSRSAPILALSGLAIVVVACASISRKYESDVRFERCYALDWKKDVDASIRSRCWEEWLTHYSKDQTVDRIQYARAQSLGGGAVPTAEPIASASAGVAKALPEPTSVFSPVPVMASSPGATAKVSAVVSAPVQPRTGCEGKCDRNLEACLTGCGSSVCENYCAQRHAKCAARCSVH